MNEADAARSRVRDDAPPGQTVEVVVLNSTPDSDRRKPQRQVLRCLHGFFSHGRTRHDQHRGIVTRGSGACCNDSYAVRPVCCEMHRGHRAEIRTRTS